MNTSTTPFLLRCWHDWQENSLRVRVLQIETDEVVDLADNSFVVRLVRLHDQALPHHCIHIRHVASGCETYVQGGPGLREFVRLCLRSDEPGAPEFGPVE